MINFARGEREGCRMKLKRLNGFSRNGFMKFIVISLTLTLLLVVSGANSAEPVVVWERTYGGNANDWANSIIETSDGYVVAGHTESKGAGGADAWIIKLDRNGNIVWDRTYGGSDWDWADSVIETSDGYYVVVGYTASKGAGSGDAWVIKLDRDGNIVWDKTYGGSDWDRSFSITSSSNGCCIVVGDTKSKRDTFDIWVLKINYASSQLNWDKTIGWDRSDEVGYSVVRTSDGYYVIAGWTKPKEKDEVDAQVIKLKDQTPESIHPIELYTNDSTTNKSSNLEYTLKDQNQKPIKTTTETVNTNQLIVLISVLVISFISIAAARSKRRKDLDKVKKYKHALDENVADTLKIGSAPPVPTPFPDFPQELLTKYQPLKYLGEGGFAKVFKCKRLNDGKIVAVKIPKVSNDFVRRSFLKEVAAWFNLYHPNIVKLYDADYKPIEHIEVEFIEGVEVNGKIVRDLDEYPKPVDESTAIKLIKGIAEGLSHAHSRGIIHRDLKPLNILLTPSLIPKITDWGLAKLASSSTTTPALSPLYAAPEQIDSAKYGKPDHRTDIYQLGLIFYELLTGKSPYEGYTPAAIAGKILSEETKPPLPSKFNSVLAKYDGIIERMLAKRKENRYQSVEEFMKHLKSIGEVQDELEELKKSLSETKQSLGRSRSKEEIERLTKEAVEKTAKIAILSAKLNDKVGLISALEDMKLYTKENLDELLNAISQIELMISEGIPISDEFVNMLEVLLQRILRENR